MYDASKKPISKGYTLIPFIHILEKKKLQEQKRNQQLPGPGGGARRYIQRRTRKFAGRMMNNSVSGLWR